MGRSVYEAKRNVRTDYGAVLSEQDDIDSDFMPVSDRSLMSSEHEDVNEIYYSSNSGRNGTDNPFNILGNDSETDSDSDNDEFGDDDEHDNHIDDKDDATDCSPTSDAEMSTDNGGDKGGVKDTKKQEKKVTRKSSFLGRLFGGKKKKEKIRNKSGKGSDLSDGDIERSESQSHVSENESEMQGFSVMDASHAIEDGSEIQSLSTQSVYVGDVIDDGSQLIDVVDDDSSAVSEISKERSKKRSQEERRKKYVRTLPEVSEREEDDDIDKSFSIVVQEEEQEDGYRQYNSNLKSDSAGESADESAGDKHSMIKGIYKNLSSRKVKDPHHVPLDAPEVSSDPPERKAKAKKVKSKASQSERKEKALNASQSERKEKALKASQSERKEKALKVSQSERKEKALKAAQSERKEKALKASQSERKEKALRKQQIAHRSATNHGVSNRVDYTGKISSSSLDVTDKSSQSISLSALSVTDNITDQLHNEVHRLKTLLELMMTRMDLYERQSECLVEASVDHNRKWKMATIEAYKASKKDVGQSPTDKSLLDIKNLLLERTAQDQWIRKLETIQRGYRHRIMTTQTQLKTLRYEHIITSKQIVDLKNGKEHLADSGMTYYTDNRTDISEIPSSPGGKNIPMARWAGTSGGSSIPTVPPVRSISPKSGITEIPPSLTVESMLEPEGTKMPTLLEEMIVSWHTHATDMSPLSEKGKLKKKKSKKNLKKKKKENSARSSTARSSTAGSTSNS